MYLSILSGCANWIMHKSIGSSSSGRGIDRMETFGVNSPAFSSRWRRGFGFWGKRLAVVFVPNPCRIIRTNKSFPFPASTQNHQKPNPKFSPKSQSIFAPFKNKWAIANGWPFIQIGIFHGQEEGAGNGHWWTCQCQCQCQRPFGFCPFCASLKCRTWWMARQL